MKRLGLLLALWTGAAAAQTTGEYQPYRRTHVPDKEVCLYLANRAFVYTPDAAGNDVTPGDTEFAAIDASFASWQTVSNLCSDVTFTAGPRTDTPVVGYDRTNSANNQNVLTFRQQACRDVVPPGDDCELDGSCGNKYRCWAYGDFVIALTTTTYSTRTGAIFDADIELNAAPHGDGTAYIFTAVSSPVCPLEAPAPNCVSTDIQNTLTHEIGHAIGLDHSEVPGSTMEATAPPGETHKRIIDSGSAEGFCEIYPRAQPSTSCEGTNLLHEKIIAVNSGSSCAAAPGGPLALGLLVLALSALRGGRGARR